MNEDKTEPPLKKWDDIRNLDKVLKIRTVFFYMLVLVLGTHPFFAQEETNPLPNYVRDVLNTLQGEFRWKMIRPSDSTVLRTGTKTSSYRLDSLALLSHETFDSSDIRQMAVFGFRQKDSTFFSVGMYNVDIGPHTIEGRFNKHKKRIEFSENDSTRLYLNMIDASKYYWTYQTLKDGHWKDRDLKIVFERQ